MIVKRFNSLVVNGVEAVAFIGLLSALNGAQSVKCCTKDIAPPLVDVHELPVLFQINKQVFGYMRSKLSFGRST